MCCYYWYDDYNNNIGNNEIEYSYSQIHRHMTIRTVNKTGNEKSDEIKQSFKMCKLNIFGK